MANLVYPSGAESFNQGASGQEKMLQSEVMDTDGECQLLHGGHIYLDSSGAALAVTMSADIVVGSSWMFTAPAGGTNDATVTLASGMTWDGTNDVATFNAAGETIFADMISATRLMVANISGLTFS